ncbi:two-component system response regulator [Sansalvadorimonas sp. 2012CJ34-2]|uniref:Two-component system response regulator n=1 Tax=Parendozoicomonas callyspongiae TaxID=2942213 RepID=A0ABT0PGY7_9GAMM|nr:two-component system response regulator [Sansalvadorimonas sp. 2012CJ34-2]MCL6270639.1 two-component system response regulator [Sansalvadorimonas sp. 2012CJ34-2]
MFTDSEQTSAQTVLVVDDTAENIAVLREILLPDYKVKAALNGTKALKIAQSNPQPDLILLDIMMPDMDGYEVCRRLKADPKTQDIPVIFISAMGSDEDEEKGLDLGAVDYLIKPVRPGIVRARVRTHLALHNQTRHLGQLVNEKTEELKQSRKQVIDCLGRAAEFKDNETGMHVIRMSHYVGLIARAIGEPESWVDLLMEAAPMHDVGKIGIPDAVLLKPGKLDDDKWETMKKHPEFGCQILGQHDSGLMHMAYEIAKTHHEKWDGSGYPGGLKGEDIPLSSRIVAVADVFDALTTERPYKRAWSVDEAIDWIEQQSGTHFEPRLVQAFRRVLPEALEVMNTYAEKVA